SRLFFRRQSFGGRHRGTAPGPPFVSRVLDEEAKLCLWPGFPAPHSFGRQENPTAFFGPSQAGLSFFRTRPKGSPTARRTRPRIFSKWLEDRAFFPILPF